MKIHFLFLIVVVFHLQYISSSNVDFSVFRSHNLRTYTTTIKLGYPPLNFTVLIDTGSDLTWIPCKSCVNCPQFSGANQVLHQFDENVSTTEKLVQCTAKRCQCSNDSCNYKITYEDMTTASSGHFLEDWFWIDSNASWARLIFGCSTTQYGRLANEGTGFDGILAFNQDALSVVSQLKINAFSHCLKGTGDSNGFLLLGEALHPDLVYSPMVPRTSQYSLYLKRIIVNGKTLSINPKLFELSKNSRGTIVDSGTNGMLLVGEAYDELIGAVNSFVSPHVREQHIIDNQICYIINSSISEAFPTIVLNFAQDATLKLNPENYLIPIFSLVGQLDWCINILRTKDITILGDPIFHNKLFVYDLARQRIGWTNYDCLASDRELAVNLSIIPRHMNVANRQQIEYINILYVLIILLF